MKLKKHVIKETMRITKLPIDQSIGRYTDEVQPCCVGARLAGFFKTDDTFFLSGLDAFAESIGCTRLHVLLMFRSAGAGYNPFSDEQWQTTPREVWRNMLEIEKVPKLKGKDFCNSNLSFSNISGQDLSGTSLYDAKLCDANFSDCKLRNANLRNVDAYRTNFRGTDFRDATMEGFSGNSAYFYKSDFRKANMKNANFCYSDCRGADFRKSELK